MLLILNQIDQLQVFIRKVDWLYLPQLIGKSVEIDLAKTIMNIPYKTESSKTIENPQDIKFSFIAKFSKFS